MARLDSTSASDSPAGTSPGSAASTRLSLEGNEGGTKQGVSSAKAEPTETGRGHSAHSGNDTNGLHEPPSLPKQIDHIDANTTIGIDVSEFQNTIDWTQVQKAGVKYAFIRASDGTTIQDSTFVQNWQGAEKAGVLVGPYHYFTTTSAVATQVDNFVSQLNKVDAGNLPAVLDVEDPTQFAKLTTAQSVALVQQWLDGVQQKTGVQPMLYMSSSFSAEVLGNAPQFDKYKLWVADYTTAAQPIVPKPWTNWNFWQHADNGIVPGISGGVDMDYFNGPAQTLPITKPAADGAKTHP